jgi:hypothetical protein
MSEPQFSIIVPSMGREDLLDCLWGSLDRAPGARDYEVCFGLDPAGSIHARSDVLLATGNRLCFGMARTPGMSSAVNAAFSLSQGEWLVLVPDDVVFLPGWDDFSFGLRENRALCFELLEPLPGSFPPPVLAGESPQDYDGNIASRAARERAKNPVSRVPGEFFVGAALIHRSRWVRWPEHADPYSMNDIAWMRETYLTHPDLAFGRMPRNCLYHFVRGSVRAAGIQAPEDTGQRFLTHYGLSIQDAYQSIYRRSEALWI